MLEILELPFMQRALISAILIGLISSFFSIFVVQRRMSFLGSGLAHATFGGIALGLFLGVSPLWIALPFTLLVGILIEITRKKSPLQPDTLIGVFFSISMGLGIVFLSLRKEYSPEAMSFLFGSLLAVSQEDVYSAFVLFFLSILLLPKWKAWAYASFDENLAKTDRLNVSRDNFLLVIFLALTVVISAKILGIVLMAASLVIPGASARLLSSRFAQMTIYAVLIGVSSSILGLFLSYYLDIPSGATIVLTQSGFFFLCMIWKKLSAFRR
ncbi:MAG: metal ABC transporter permease [Bdellovibrionota bacterium]|jgi:zinc transport system permease protein